MTTAEEQHQKSREENFVEAIIKRCQSDKGFAARLKRADNPATEYQSWEILAAFGIDLEKSYARLPFATVGAAIAKAKIDHNGTLGLGQAIARCYDDGRESDQAKAKLRRILACQDSEELCRILRPVIALIQSRIIEPLNYSLLLTQLYRFHWNQERIKTAWAQEFYQGTTKQKENI